MGIALGQLWDALRLEDGESKEGVLSVAAEDLPGPPRIALPMDSPNKDVILTKLQRELTRAREDKRSDVNRTRYERLQEDDPARLAYKAFSGSADAEREGAYSPC